MKKFYQTVFFYLQSFCREKEGTKTKFCQIFTLAETKKLIEMMIIKPKITQSSRSVFQLFEIILIISESKNLLFFSWGLYTASRTTSNTNSYRTQKKKKNRNPTKLTPCFLSLYFSVFDNYKLYKIKVWFQIFFKKMNESSIYLHVQQNCFFRYL